jgi:hypothetical protein
VLLGLPDKPSLEAAVAKITGRGIRYEAFFEPDNDHGLTAVCTESLYGTLRNLFRGFPLWQPQTGANAPHR